MKEFSGYLVEISFHIHTDHKLLLSTKLLDELPLRIQRFWMRLLNWAYDMDLESMLLDKVHLIAIAL